MGRTSVLCWDRSSGVNGLVITHCTLRTGLSVECCNGL
jgi:hypothetical protein